MRSDLEPRIMAQPDHHLGRGRQAECHAALAHPADDGTRLGAVFQDLSLGVQVKSAFRQIPEKSRILVHDPDDLKTATAGALGQWRSAGLGQRAVGAGNRVSVRVNGGITEKGLDPVNQTLRGRVFHVLGLLVNLVPRHLQSSGQEQLQQAMAANHLERQPLSRGGQTGPFIGSVSGQAGLGQRFQHAGDRSWRNVQSLRQFSRRHGRAGLAARGDQRDGLDVVFDSQTGHGTLAGHLR